MCYSCCQSILPAVIGAATKGPQGQFGAGQPDEKFLNLLLPILTSVVPAVINAATKGPQGQGGAGQIDEKGLGDLLRLYRAYCRP